MHSVEKYQTSYAFVGGNCSTLIVTVYHRVVNTMQAMKDLDWRPKYDLSTGLKDSYEWDFKLRSAEDKTDDYSMDDQILDGT